MFYQRWIGLGKAIANHMPVLVLACVAAGVLLPGVFGPIEHVVPVLFAFMTFQGALSNSVSQLLRTFRHPAPLLVILGVTLIVMPVLAFVLASMLFPHSPNIVTGIVLEYCIPVGIVSFMWVGMFDGNGSLGLAAILISTVLAPFTIPVTMQLLLGATIHIDAVDMTVDMIFMIALPALAGMLVNDFTRGWGASRLSPSIAPACKVLLLIIITSNSTAMSEYVLHMNAERLCVALFILLFASSGFVWGIMIARLMGRSAAEMVTMCFDCGLRNISSGAVIATQYFPGEVVYPVMCGTIFQQLLASVFGNIMRRLRPAQISGQKPSR